MKNFETKTEGYFPCFATPYGKWTKIIYNPVGAKSFYNNMITPF